ncbi:MAG TPA: hypothetical protein VEU47_13520, partial [Candidatus Cybelea sp.]|nr:hypothetical protein [Candidatus Cybelea sp.]
MTALPANHPYTALEARFRRLSAVGGALSMLGWDQAAMMPAGGAAARAEQMATLGVIRHENLTDPALADLLAAAEGQAGTLDEWQAANLREMRREWRHAAALPADLVEARSRAASACEMVWRGARKDNDFARLRPSLEDLLRLTREIAQAKAEAFDVAPYDALLDEYEPDGSSAAIDAIFGELADFLPAYVERAQQKQ